MHRSKYLLNHIYIALLILLIQYGCSHNSNPLSSNIELVVEYISQLPQEHNFYSIEFINNNIGWAVGKKGVIYKTENGGSTWEIQNSSLSDDLVKVQFIDAQSGWIAGTNNVLFTNDAGNTWQSELSNIPFSRFVSIYFVNKNKGWISGTPDGKIYHTSDGGANWHVQQVDTMGRVVDLVFIDELLGYSFSNITGIYKTMNGGATWNKNSTTRFCSTIYFLNYLVGFSGNNVMLSSLGNDKANIFITTDGGSTWSEQTIPDATAVWKISFINSTTGFAIVGALCSFTQDPADWVECGQLIYSSNEGSTWNTLDPKLSLNEVIDFKLFSKNKLAVLTSNGRIYFLLIKN